MTLRQQFLRRPLPMPVRRYQDETTRSFIRRINAASVPHHGELLKALSRDRRPWLYNLSDWTQTEPEILRLAMPQLAGRHPDQVFRQKIVGRPIRKIHAAACHHCTLTRGAGPYVEGHTTRERVICPEHSLWIGEGIAGTGDQFSVRDCPEITKAWHHHKNLISRHGHSEVRKAFESATLINWRWHEQFLHFSSAVGIYDDLAATLPRQANTQALVATALYPSVIMLTAALVSPFWRRIACSPHPEAFLERVSREITDGWKPQGISDPLCQWMETGWASGTPVSDTILLPKSR